MRTTEIHVLFFGDSHNLGRSKETSADVLRRWRGEAAARASDLETKVVFAVGANDTSEEEEAFRVRASRAVDALIAMVLRRTRPAFRQSLWASLHWR